MPKEYHFIRELRDQPARVTASLQGADAQLKSLASKYAGKVDRIVLTGCGDPYMLSLAAANAFETWASIPAQAVEAAEFALYGNPRLLNERTLVILITSSGKTIKVIDAARIAGQRGAQMFALTNLVPSPITAETDQVVQTQAGWSDAFPTKQTTTALAVLYALALYWAEATRALPPEQCESLRRELYEDVPTAMQAALSLEPELQALANQHLHAPMFAYIGSGPNLTTALLGAAKIKETSQGRAEGSNLEEYAHLHGLALKEGDPVLVVTAPGIIGERNRMMARWVQSNGGKPIVVGPRSEKDAWLGLDATFLEVPDHTEMFGPLISLLPLQMFAYYIAVGRDRNADRPPDRSDMKTLQEIIYTSMLEGWENR